MRSQPSPSIVATLAFFLTFFGLTPILATCDFDSDSNSSKGADDKTADDDNDSGAGTGDDDSGADNDVSDDDVQSDDDIADDDITDDDIADNDVSDDDDIIDDDVADDDDLTGPCEEIDPNQCAKYIECDVITGAPVDIDRNCVDIESITPVGCMSSHMGCDDVITMAYDAEGTVWWFSDSCVPPDFTSCDIMNELVPGCDTFEFCEDAVDDDLGECEALPPKTCESRSDCVALYAAPVDAANNCVKQTEVQPVGCIDAGDGCMPGEHNAVDENRDVWRFFDSCLPVDFAPCEIFSSIVPGCGAEEPCEDSVGDGYCNGIGGDCVLIVESRSCMGPFQHKEFGGIACWDQTGMDGNCCVPLERTECERNSDCTITNSGCCSCGLWEGEFVGIPKSEQQQYLDDLNEHCQNIDCDVCPPSIPDFIPYAVCDENSLCQFVPIPDHCQMFANPDCTPSEETAITGCPSNWGDCGCSYNEDQLCEGLGAPMDCNYDPSGCPIDCICEGPTP